MSNTSSLPSCEDFIIAAIRSKRIKRVRQTPNTAPGIELHKVWSVAQEFYTENDFRRAINRLLQNGQLVGVKRGAFLGSRIRSFKDKLTDLPDDWDLAMQQREGTCYKWDKTVLVGTVRLYVTADGLSDTVRRVTKTDSSAASAILERARGKR